MATPVIFRKVDESDCIPEFNKYLKYSKPSGGKQQVTAIALYKGKVVSVGNNSYTKTHPQQKVNASIVGESYKEYLHAELSALVKARRPIDHLFVFRRNSSGQYRSAKPCPICLIAIHQAKIKTVTHS